MFKIVFSETTSQHQSCVETVSQRSVFLHSVRLDSVFPLKMLKNDTVCDGETYTVTQIQTSDSLSFCVFVPIGLRKEFMRIQVIIL